MRHLFKLLMLLALLPATLFAREVPVGDFFKDPEFSNVSLSPTGEYITVSVPQEDRTVLAAFRVADMKLVGKWDYGSMRHIDRVMWVNDERFFMYVSRKVGRFDFRVGTPDVYASNVDGSKRTDIPNGGYYQVVDLLDADPRRILVARSIESAFLFSMDVYDGQTRTVATAPLRFGTFLVDSKGAVRYAMGMEENRDSVTLRRNGSGWTEIHRAPMGGSVRTPLTLDASERNVLFQVSADGEPEQVVLVDAETDKATPLSSNPNVAPGRFLMASDDKTLLAVAYADGVPGYDFVNKGHPETKVYAGLINAFPEHAVAFRGSSRDGRYILLNAYSDIDPGSYYLYDKQAGKVTFLLAAMSWIKPSEMSEMRPITLKARDGTPLHGYITIPRNSNGKNLPLILNPHGGPHGPRDMWGFNPEVQFLANRGYAVLQVNFRGSGGYGNKFERLGYRNWGTTMIDDMTDAVDWAVREGIADGGRVCTYGASYGGYGALMSVVRNPTKYKCTVGYVGVYSLPLMKTDGDIPRDASGRNYLARVLPESASELQAQSAVFNIDRINVPVMLVQGGKDERVPPSQYRALKDALAKAGKPIEVDILEPKEGHGFYDYDNQVRLYTQMQAFFDKYIGSKN